ncbi:anti-sigma B factor antagonist [Paenibacillus sp. UNCCL117]|uniref:STAS domain-containing protein n=1 Tax=unclassified Paenibacillus TaxID=185978 RepID=UPI000883CC6B|nr:anti-sigma B factor antagonist [Paenibacillus sp. cl123]SFW59090.1 anti-sigma B factor antagonist [Paenibacillus sp. UNCCL117]
MMEKSNVFQVRTAKSPHATTVFLQGELDLSKVSELRSALDPYIADTSRDLVLNLKDLQYIDSTGIGVIVSVLKARDVLKAHFLVEDIPPKIKRIFDLTGITPFLQQSPPADSSGARIING